MARQIARQLGRQVDNRQSCVAATSQIGSFSLETKLEWPPGHVETPWHSGSQGNPPPRPPLKSCKRLLFFLQGRVGAGISSSESQLNLIKAECSTKHDPKTHLQEHIVKLQQSDPSKPQHPLYRMSENCCQASGGPLPVKPLLKLLRRIRPKFKCLELEESLGSAKAVRAKRDSTLQTPSGTVLASLAHVDQRSSSNLALVKQAISLCRLACDLSSPGGESQIRLQMLPATEFLEDLTLTHVAETRNPSYLESTFDFTSCSWPTSGFHKRINKA